MKYVALLRGINVGGNTLIKMAVLKEGFETLGFTDVKTYINSGNVIFSSDEKDSTKLSEKIEAMIIKLFKLNVKVLILSHEQIKQVIHDIPNDWKTKKDLRCYLAFVFPPLTAEAAAKEVSIREGVDWMDVGPGVLYLTTLMSERTKSAFTKMVGKPIYQEMTLRNLNTTQKILILLEQ